MEVMGLIAKEVGSNLRVTLPGVAAQPEAKHVCDELVSAAETWLANTASERSRTPNAGLRHIGTVNDFAQAIRGRNQRPIDCLRSLLEHHEANGGGLRWFVLRNGLIEPRTLPGAEASRYRFRLWPLCRLAAQTGVLAGAPAAFRKDIEGSGDTSDE
jgi:hypothetical protein